MEVQNPLWMSYFGLLSCGCRAISLVVLCLDPLDLHDSHPLEKKLIHKLASRSNVLLDQTWEAPGETSKSWSFGSSILNTNDSWIGSFVESDCSPLNGWISPNTHYDHSMWKLLPFIHQIHLQLWSDHQLNPQWNQLWQVHLTRLVKVWQHNMIVM